MTDAEEPKVPTFAEMKEKELRIVGGMDSQNENYGARLDAIKELQRLEDLETDHHLKERQIELEERKLDVEEKKLQETGKKSIKDTVLEILKVVIPAAASVGSVLLIIHAEKDDDLYLGSKAMNKVPKP